MRRRRSRQGSNLIELAILAPLLVLVTASIIDFGWYYFNQQNVASATRSAARIGSVTAWDEYPSYTTYFSLLSELNGVGLASSSRWVRIEYTGTEPDLTMNLKVSVKHEPLFGMLPLPESYESTVQLRMEEQADYYEPVWESNS